VKGRIAEAPVLHVPEPLALAVALRRTRVEIARAPVVAVAGDDERAFDVPACRGLRCHAISFQTRTTTAATNNASPPTRAVHSPPGSTFSAKTRPAMSA